MLSLIMIWNFLIYDVQDFYIQFFFSSWVSYIQIIISTNLIQSFVFNKDFMYQCVIPLPNSISSSSIFETEIF